MSHELRVYACSCGRVYIGAYGQVPHFRPTGFIPLTLSYAWLAERDEGLAPTLHTGVVGWWLWPAALVLVARNMLRYWLHPKLPRVRACG